MRESVLFASSRLKVALISLASLLWTVNSLRGAGSSTFSNIQASELAGPFAPLPSQCSDLDLEGAVTRFSQLITFPTVSLRDAPCHVMNQTAFEEMDKFLKATYPTVWSTLTVEKLGECSLSYLFTWPGTGPAELRPLLFIGHLDVVPVPPETLDQWIHGPFSGAIADGYIWGRGTIDVKVSASALLESITALLAAGWQPSRTLFFTFGQDEEVGGGLGAAAVAAELKRRGIEVEMILDEGKGVGQDGFYPFLSAPTALVGVAEKGYISVQVNITTEGGHSSIPPITHTSAAAILGRLLTAIDKSPPSPRMTEPVENLIQTLVPFADTWLMKYLSYLLRVPKVGKKLAAELLARQTAETAAMVRTTVAATIFSAGVAENVLPPAATLVLNFRLLPGDTMNTPLEYIARVIPSGDEKYIKAFVRTQWDLASKVTSTSSPFFGLLKEALQTMWITTQGQPVVVSPYMSLGGTDSSHYEDLTHQGILRHVPISANRTAGDQKRVHGLNERVAVEDFQRAVCTYRLIVQKWGSFKE